MTVRVRRVIREVGVSTRSRGTGLEERLGRSEEGFGNVGVFPCFEVEAGPLENLGGSTTMFNKGVA